MSDRETQNFRDEWQAIMAGFDADTAEFEQHRQRCFAAAYRMLGSVADAEDVVQEAWLRWSTRECSAVANPGAFLVRTATRLALNRLRTLRTRRESYVGPWLPEPMVTDENVADAAESVVLSESASTAMLVVLETLSPTERAVFVLREVFDYPHEDIANTLGRSVSGVRQIAHRARQHVQARRPRFDTDRSVRHQVTERFLAACQGGDLAALLDLLAPGVTLWTDGGGKVRSARNPVRGSDKVARFLTGTPRQRFFERTLQRVELNGQPGAITWFQNTADSAITVGVLDGQVWRVDIVANPDKLAALRRAASINE